MSDNLSVQAHYGLESLKDRIDAALGKAGLGEGPLDWSDLAPLDQFHIRALPATEELAEGLDLTPGVTVLDIGCGLGGPARYLAAVHGCEVTGIDLSGPFIEAARMLTERTGLAARVHFQQGDALALPFADASFDFAWTQHVAMNIADRSRFYGEIRRVLKPGGSLAIYDVVAGNGEPLIFPVPWAREPEMSFLMSGEEMFKLLQTLGFEPVSWIDTTDEGLTWFADMIAKLKHADGPPALSLAVVMGPDFAQMAANVALNLKEGRARLLQGIVRLRA